jgi:lambda repressor-like predicted transcriptional regulator
MSESFRLTRIALDIISRLRRQGSSMNAVWMRFSRGNELSRSDFEAQISKFGLPLRPGDLDIIWANVGIKGTSMTYSDFVHFITLDSIDVSILGQPTRADNVHLVKPQTTSLFDVLMSHRPEIVSTMLNFDATCTGFISTSDLESILRRFTIVGFGEVQHLIAPYNTQNNGHFNYFKLLSDLTTNAQSKITHDSAGRDLKTETITRCPNNQRTVSAATDVAKAKVWAELTDEEKTLLHIARQAKGKGWRRVFETARDIDVLAPALRNLSIYVLNPDLKSCIAKYGKESVVEMIEDFVTIL